MSDLRCPICCGELSYCGEPSDDGIPTIDCALCRCRESVREQQAEIERLNTRLAEQHKAAIRVEAEIAREQAADDRNWRWIVTEQLTHSVDEISNGRARDIIHELRAALLPFSARHATMHKYYDSDSGHVPESVTVPREWLAEAYRVLKEGRAND